VNADIENAVLYCMISDAECCSRGLQSLREGDFTRRENVALLQSIRSCAAAGTVDLVTLSTFTNDGGAHAAHVCGQFYPPSNFGSYLDALHAQNRRKRSIAAAREALSAAEQNAEGWETLMQQAATLSVVDNGDVAPVGVRAIDAIDKLFADRAAALSTGFPGLDGVTRGISPGELFVVAARPGMGKTAFATRIATNAARGGAVTAVFSLEMSQMMLLRRIVYAEAKVAEAQLLAQNEAAMLRALEAAGRIAEMPLYIHDKASITADEIASACYRIKQKEGKIDLVVIDYLQLITARNARNQNREQTVAEISRRLKLFALDMNVPVLLLSQISREVEKRGDGVPRLADLRESGAIEQDADVVLFICGEEDNAPNMRRLAVAKNRSGRTGSISVGWDGATFRFYPITE